MKPAFRGILWALLLILLCACQKDTVTIVDGRRETASARTAVSVPQTEAEQTTESTLPEPETSGGESVAESPAQTGEEGVEQDYILNTSSKKFHLPTCGSVNQMKESNRQEYHGTREALIEQGYDPCGNCHP